MTTERRRCWAALVCVGMTPLGYWRPVWAQDISAADVLARMHACVAEKEDARRLACFDEQMARAPAAANTTSSQAPPSGTSAAASSTPAAAPLSPQDSFGMSAELQRKLQSPEERKQAASRELEQLSGRVVTVSYRQQGKAVITLDNGQVWQQMESDSPLSLAIGQTITIRRGTLGSFYLTTPLGFALNVKRLH